MARKPTPPPVDITEHVEGVELPDALDERFTQYAKMTLEDRALPDARDGLKPSQRRILVAMNDLKLGPRGSTKKSAKICGDTSGNYHPHGEAVVYPTMFRMAQDWVMREPLILGQGNFGAMDGDPPAAMRYTEAKLSAVGAAMLEELSPDVVPFVPNYNEELQEPTVLPTLFPNLLVNGTQGIAVGWATNVPPHNYREVAKAIALYIKKGADLTAGDVIKVMPGPDFPTGGKLLGQDGVLEYYKTGRGSIRLEGAWEVTKSSRGVETITINQLPYQSSPEALAVEIEALVKDGKLTGISDLKNLTSEKTGIQVIVEVAKGSNAPLVINNLLKNTSLRKSSGVNITVMVGDKRMIPDASIITLIETFVNHRRVCLTNKFKAELQRQLDRLHILEGLISVSKRIDEVIKIVRNADDDKDAALKLIAAKIVTSQAQADAVLAITLRQLTKLEGQKLLDEKAKREERVVWLRNVLANPGEIDSLIVTEQLELSQKIGTERRTEIVGGVADIDNEELVKDEQLVISLTGDGYVRSTPSAQFRVQGRGGKGVNGTDGKRDDNIFEMFESGSKELILFFTNKGLMFKKKAYEIPQCSRTSKGTHTSNLLNLAEGEHVTNMIAVKDLTGDGDRKAGYLTIATKKGLIKRSDLSEYDTSLKTAGLTAIKLNDGDQVAFVLHTDGESDIFIVTANGNCVRYSEDLVTVQGRATQGVRALKLDSDDAIVQIMSLDKTAEPDILVVTAGGFGKRTSANEYRAMSGRNVRGYAVINKASLKKNGLVVGACPIVDGDTLLVASCNGKVIRMDANDVRATGRATGGVRVVRLDDNDCVSRVTKLKEDADEGGDDSSPKGWPHTSDPAPTHTLDVDESDDSDDADDEPTPPKAVQKAPAAPKATADDVNAKGKFGYTALHRAAIDGDAAEIDRLIALGAKKTAKDNGGKMPWQKALSANHPIELVKKLTP